MRVSAAGAADGPRKGFNPPPRPFVHILRSWPSLRTPGLMEGRCVVAGLPDKPKLEWLRKQAKQRLRVLRSEHPETPLAHAQFDLARDFGFTSWRDLKAHVDALTIDGRLIAAARNGDADTLGA